MAASRNEDGIEITNPDIDIAEIFADALELEPHARSMFVKDRCAGNAGAICEVELLLDEHDRAMPGEFLSGSALALEAEHIVSGDADQRIGQTFGRYKLISRLGAGGMGAIYLAVRSDDFEKHAAVKIIKRGMDTDAILDRFRNERQILADLEHPNIARLVDGGTTDDGLPYFVMEYVDGISIREYCRDLSEKQVLRLFLRVCSAVSFAHQKLIVHRDLKPSNILVDKMGEPKLLDFGIAKLLDQPGQDETHTIHRILTPAYASPEQMAGAAVGTGSDVYSLGKVLSELLRGGEKDQTGRRLDADLQKVLSAAMRDEPELRYSSVDRFADDIKRYLDDMPVTARKLSLSYRTRKFVRRNRAKVALAALFLISVTAGLAATVWKAREANRERVVADRRFDNLRRLSDSFVTELHAAIQNLPGSLPARQLLLKRATEQLDALAEESGDNRALQSDLANAYYNLSSLPDMDIAEKRRVLAKADGILEQLLNDDPENLGYIELRASIKIELADTRKVEGSVGDGVKYARSAVDLLERAAATGPNDAKHIRALREATSTLASMYLLAGNAKASLELARRTLELSLKYQASDPNDDEAALFVGRSHLQIGHVLTVLGDYSAAVPELNESLEAETRAHAEHPNDTSINYYIWAVNRRLAIANQQIGDLSSAFEYANRSQAIIESLRALSPTDVGYNRNSAITHLLLGQLLLETKRASAAVPHFRRALELSQSVLAANPAYLESEIDVARSEGNLGHALFLSGDKSHGIEMLKDALAKYDEVSRADSENAVLKRDHAETAMWAAASNDPVADHYRDLSSRLWQELGLNGELSAADSKLAGGFGRS